MVDSRARRAYIPVPVRSGLGRRRFAQSTRRLSPVRHQLQQPSEQTGEQPERFQPAKTRQARRDPHPRHRSLPRPLRRLPSRPVHTRPGGCPDGIRRAGHGGGPDHLQAGPWQVRLRPPPRPHRPDPGLRPTRPDRTGRIRNLRRVDRSRRFPGGRGRRLQDPDRRDNRHGGCPEAPFQVPPRPARKMARPAGRRDPVPAALRGPDHQPRGQGGLPQALPAHPVHSAVHGRRGVRRSGNPDPPAPLRRRAGEALQDPPPGPRHAALHAHRRRTLSQAVDRRRHGARVRDRPRLPQRRDRPYAQPRIHHAGVLYRLRGLSVYHGPGGAPLRPCLPGSQRHAGAHVPGPADRPVPALAAAVHARRHPRARRRRRRRHVDRGTRGSVR